MTDGRAERPRGLLAWLRETAATALADDPAPPSAWSPPRGLGELAAHLDDIRAAPGRTVGPINPLATLPGGYEYRAVPEAAWCAVAGVELDVGRVAWALASEAPDIRKFPAYAWAIGEAICNAGTDLVTRDKRPAVDGHFGRQSGRWCASLWPPTERHLRCAELVVGRARAGEANILAGGAVQWLDPLVQVAMHAKKPATNPSPEDVVRARYRYGRRWVGPRVDAFGEVLLDHFRLLLFAPSGGVDIEQCLNALADGRRRWRKPA